MGLTPWQRGLQPSNLRRRVGSGSLAQEREACRDAEVCGRRDQGVRVVGGGRASAARSGDGVIGPGRPPVDRPDRALFFALVERHPICPVTNHFVQQLGLEWGAGSEGKVLNGLLAQMGRVGPPLVRGGKAPRKNCEICLV